MSIHSGVCFAMQDNIFMRQLKDFHSFADSLLLLASEKKICGEFQEFFFCTEAHCLGISEGVSRGIYSLLGS